MRSPTLARGCDIVGCRGTRAFASILSFRDLEQETNDAIPLFGNKDACGIVLLKPFAEYYDEYAVRVAELQADFPLGQPIVGEAAQKAFIAPFGSILRPRNFLRSFEEFTGSELLAPRTVQDYQSVYLNLYRTSVRSGDRRRRPR